MAALALAAAIPMVPALGATTTVRVEATNWQWSPTPVSLSPGDSIEFVLVSGSHSWVSDSGMGACALPCTKAFPSEGVFDYHCGIHPSMKGRVLVGSPPDVDITEPLDGGAIEGVAMVRGTASHLVHTISRVDLRVDSGAFVAATIDSGTTSVLWSYALSTVTMTNGAHTLTARATAPNGMVDEHTIVVFVDNPGTVDLRISSVTPVNGYPGTRIFFSIHNQGNSHAPQTRATVDYLYQGVWRPVAYVTQAPMSPNAEVTRSVDWEGEGFLVGTFPIRVTADALNAVTEPSEEDNIRFDDVAFLHPALPGIDLRDP